MIHHGVDLWVLHVWPILSNRLVIALVSGVTVLEGSVKRWLSLLRCFLYKRVDRIVQREITYRWEILARAIGQEVRIKGTMLPHDSCVRFIRSKDLASSVYIILLS
jgi:hypothetical protein